MNPSPLRIACFGGIYNNYLALEVAIQDAKRRGVDAIYCLGDLGAFGPYPDHVFPLIHEHQIQCVQGNYDDSIGNALDDCQCGYADPRDNHFAQISYDYTLANTSGKNRNYLRSLPKEIRLSLGPLQVLLCHGSPRRTNEFLWESTTSTPFLEYLAETHAADLIIGTHTGIKWQRSLAGGKAFINCGTLGRPENRGQTNVWYALIEISPQGHHSVDFIPIEYDHKRLAKEMQQEGLPDEFRETILTGWWTSCLEILPSKERRQGRH